jgi:glycopeptide antibiotics resistance protein
MIRSTLWIVLIGYTLLLIYWMFIGFHRVQFQSSEFRYNIVPFSTLTNYFVNFSSFNLRTWFINIFGNIAVFVPFGILLPLLFKPANKLGFFIVIFVGPLFVLELMQTLLRLGSFDIDDIILNGIGAMIGFMVLAFCRAALRGSIKTKRLLLTIG